MYGGYEQKFASLRAFWGYMTAHPGKKLGFMGNEFGQFKEWDYTGGLDWLLLDFPAHAALKKYSAALNNFYLSRPALWEIDFAWEGFRWIVPDDNLQNILVFRRIDKSGNEIIAAVNLAPVERRGYEFGVTETAYREVFNSDNAEFGGAGVGNPGILTAREKPMHGRTLSLSVTIPALSALFFEKYEGFTVKAAKAVGQTDGGEKTRK
jgi:1,4-alpha-glucan branching enzyme